MFSRALVLHQCEISELSYDIWNSIQDTFTLEEEQNRDLIIDYIAGYLEELLNSYGCTDFLIWNEDKDRWELMNENYLASLIYQDYIMYDIKYYLLFRAKKSNRIEKND